MFSETILIEHLWLPCCWMCINFNRADDDKIPTKKMKWSTLHQPLWGNTTINTNVLEGHGSSFLHKAIVIFGYTIKESPMIMQQFNFVVVVLPLSCCVYGASICHTPTLLSMSLELCVGHGLKWVCALPEGWSNIYLVKCCFPPVVLIFYSLPATLFAWGVQRRSAG